MVWNCLFFLHLQHLCLIPWWPHSSNPDLSDHGAPFLSFSPLAGLPEVKLHLLCFFRYTAGNVLAGWNHGDCFTPSHISPICCLYAAGLEFELSITSQPKQHYLSRSAALFRQVTYLDTFWSIPFTLNLEAHGAQDGNHRLCQPGHYQSRRKAAWVASPLYRGQSKHQAFHFYKKNITK